MIVLASTFDSEFLSMFVVLRNLIKAGGREKENMRQGSWVEVNSCHSRARKFLDREEKRASLSVSV